MADSAGSIAFDIVLGTSNFTSGLGKAVSLASASAKTISGVFNGIKNVLSGLGSTLVSAMSDIISTGEQYETSMAQVKTIMDTTVMSAQDMSDAIIKQSNATGQAATEIASSVYDAISGGVSTADAVGMVDKANQLAVGGFTEVGTAMNALTTVINAYGLSAEDATHISDVLITTQNLGKTTVDDLAGSMGRVIPTAAAYGVSIDQLGASYSVLTASGIATTQATTYMQQMFAELGKQSSTVAKTVKDKTGKSFAECMKSGMSLGDVIQVLSDSVEGDTTAFANLWSSQTAGTAALALANAGAQEYNETLESMGDSTGATEKAYDTMTDTLEYKTQKISTTWSNFKTSLYEKFSKPLGQIVGLFSDKFGAFTDSWSGYADRIIASFQENGISGAINTAKDCLDEFKAGLQGLADEWTASDDPSEQFLGNVLNNLLSIEQTVEDVGAFFSTWQSEGLEAAVKGVAFPTWQSIKETASTWWNTEVSPALVDIMVAVFGVTPQDAQTAIDTVTGFWSGIVGTAEATMNAVFKVLTGTLEEGDVQDWWDSVSDTVGGLLKTVFSIAGIAPVDETSVTTWWEGVKNTISGLITIAFGITGTDQESQAKTAEGINQFWTGVSGQLQGVGQIVAEIVHLDDITTAISNWWNGGDGQKGAKDAFADSFKFVFGIDFSQFDEQVKEWWAGIQSSDWYQFLAGIFGGGDGTANNTSTYGVDWEWDAEDNRYHTKDNKYFWDINTNAYYDSNDNPVTIDDIKVGEGVAEQIQQQIDSEEYEVDVTANVNTNFSNAPLLYSLFHPHATGLSYVPYDGYLAELHRGERVMTALQNYNYSNKNSAGYGEYVDSSTALHVDTMVLSSDVDASVLATQINDLSRKRNKAYGY